MQAFRRAAVRILIESRRLVDSLSLNHSSQGPMAFSEKIGGRGAGGSRKRIVLGWLSKVFSWRAGAEQAPVTEAVSSPVVFSAGWCPSLRTSAVRRFLRHLRASFAVFSEKTMVRTVPPRGAFFAGCGTGSNGAAPGGVFQAAPSGKSVLSAAKIALAFSIAFFALASEASATPP